MVISSFIQFDNSENILSFQNVGYVMFVGYVNMWNLFLNKKRDYISHHISLYNVQALLIMVYRYMLFSWQFDIPPIHVMILPVEFCVCAYMLV